MAPGSSFAWGKASKAPLQANGAAQENHLTEQPEHLDWDGVHGEALRMALRRLPGVFDAALLPMVASPSSSVLQVKLPYFLV